MIVTLTEANTYFSTRYGAAGKWPVTDAEKTAVLQTAENDLLAAYGSLGADDSTKRCVFEQAFARLLDPDIDSRLAMQAQGISEAGMIKEKYAGARSGVFVCAYAAQVLGDPGSGTPIGGAFVELDDSAETTVYNFG